MMCVAASAFASQCTARHPVQQERYRTETTCSRMSSRARRFREACLLRLPGPAAFSSLLPRCAHTSACIMQGSHHREHV